MHDAIVIGLGSMGRRRIRLLKTVGACRSIRGVDLSQERRDLASKEFGIQVYQTIGEAVGVPGADVAFVCTSPLSHGNIVMDCLEHGCHVFTEINLLCDWYDQAMSLARNNGLRLFISSTFLYRREVDYIIDATHGKSVNYIYHSGQYLPDWHPWESYKNFFVSDKRTNACREILAIEFPWLLKAFGEIETISVMKGKNTSLDIDFDDNYIISMRHKSGSKGVFCQDIVARKGLRRLEVYSEDMHLFWDGTPDSLKIFDMSEKTMRDVVVEESVEHDSRYAASISEDAYLNEIAAFLAFVDGKSGPRYTFDDDAKVLGLIDKIEAGVYG